MYKFKYYKPYKELEPGEVISRLDKLNFKFPKDLVNFFIENQGGLVSNSEFEFKNKRYAVIKVYGLGSRKLVENLLYNYEGVTSSVYPDMLEIILLENDNGIYLSLKDNKYYLLDKEIEDFTLIASSIENLMRRFRTV